MPRDTVEKPTRGRKNAARSQNVEAVSRAFRLLEAFASQPKPLSLAQLAAAAGVDKSASQRLSNTLLELGYLQRVPGGLVPACKSLDRAYDYLRCNPVISRAYPVLVELRRACEERTSFSLFDDLTMVYAIRLESKQDAYYAHLPGRRIPTFCTSAGRAVLARLPERDAMDIVNRSDRKAITPKTTTGKQEARARIEQARRTGYSIAIEEVLIGEVAIGAAVVDGNGAPIGAVSVAGSLSEWKQDEFARRFGPLAVAAAQAISGA
jgi:DNA-binding IclR family transcriptional regulator